MDFRVVPIGHADRAAAGAESAAWAILFCYLTVIVYCNIKSPLAKGD